MAERRRIQGARRHGNSIRHVAMRVAAEDVVQRQLDAYNARDLDGWLATYQANAEQYLLHGGLLAAGHEAIRQRMKARFDDPALHAKLVSRTVIDDVVVAYEIVTPQPSRRADLRRDDLHLRSS